MGFIIAGIIIGVVLGIGLLFAVLWCTSKYVITEDYIIEEECEVSYYD